MVRPQHERERRQDCSLRRDQREDISIEGFSETYSPKPYEPQQDLCTRPPPLPVPTKPRSDSPRPFPNEAQAAAATSIVSPTSGHAASFPASFKLTANAHQVPPAYQRRHESSKRYSRDHHPPTAPRAPRSRLRRLDQAPPRQSRPQRHTRSRVHHHTCPTARIGAHVEPTQS